MSFNNNFQKKKLLFIYYKLNKPGGITKVLCNLANELADHFDISILILIKDKISFYHLDHRIKIISVDSYQHTAFTVGCVGIEKHFSWIPFKNNIKKYFYDYGAHKTMIEWLTNNQNQYDTFISCMYKLSIGISMNRKLSKKTIAWEHTDHRIGGKLFNPLRKKNYKNLKALVAINSQTFNFFQKLNKISYLIPNIMDEMFEKVEFNNEKENIIIFVGRLDKNKNVKDLLEIFECSNIPNTWKLFIVGNGTERKNLENQIKNYKKKSRITFFGSKNSNEVLEMYNRSKIFAFTSLIEAFGNVLVEAMMCGNALIAYDCDTGPADIINEKNGFLIPLNNKEMFKEKLEYLTNQPETLDKLMRSSYEESFSWKKDTSLKQWKEIL